jgi:hypothetical protein
MTSKKSDSGHGPFTEANGPCEYKNFKKSLDKNIRIF